MKNLLACLFLLAPFLSISQDSAPYYPEGPDKWNQYIAKKTMSISMAAPNSVRATSKYTIKVTFRVELDGMLTPTTVTSSPASSYLEEKCKKAIAASPKWIPAVKEGKPHVRSLIQPFTFRFQ